MYVHRYSFSIMSDYVYIPDSSIGYVKVYEKINCRSYKSSEWLVFLHSLHYIGIYVVVIV